MLQMKTAILVDDDDVFNFLNRNLLQKSTFFNKIHICSSGIKALDLLKEITPDIIFLDIRMPIMSGFEFLDEFEKLPDTFKSKINIVMLTSSLDDSDIEKAFTYKNVVSFINKPFNTNKLSEVLEKISLL
jgi:CheY-like chemotaxis protein